MSLPEISDVQRLRLEPGDSLVVRCPARLDMATVVEVKERVRAILRIADDVPVLVLPDGMGVEVLSGGRG
jgi:hypothetical protein